MSVTDLQAREHNLPHYPERVDLAASFRWTAQLDMHEGVANHFSLAVNEDGSQFLMNPNQVHFSLIRASDLLLIDANDPKTMERPDAPDPTAWGLHGALHRLCPHARCAMHVHSSYSTVLSCLKDPVLPPLDQNAASYFNRIAYDLEYGGLALDEEAERACSALSDPSKKILVMGNHGVMVVGDSVADTFNRMYYFERAVRTYVQALWTGRELSILSDQVAEKTAQQMEGYDAAAERFLTDIKRLLDREGADYAS